MSCRTGNNASITGSAAAITGASTVTVQKSFHALHQEGERLQVPVPHPEEVVAFLQRRKDLLEGTGGVPESRGQRHSAGLSQAREQVEAGNVPDGPTWHAWQHLLAESETRQQKPRDTNNESESEARNLHRSAIAARSNALAATVDATGRDRTAAWKHFDAADFEVNATARRVEQAVRRGRPNASEKEILTATLRDTANDSFDEDGNTPGVPACGNPGPDCVEHNGACD